MQFVVSGKISSVEFVAGINTFIYQVCQGYQKISSAHMCKRNQVFSETALQRCI